MESPTLKETDAYSAAKAAAPRVSLAYMEALIAQEHYFTAGEAVVALQQPTSPQLDLLTICILVMSNGFTLIGKSAPASPENFDAGKGKRFAYEDAIKQLWPLEGYLLRERLAPLVAYAAAAVQQATGITDVARAVAAPLDQAGSDNGELPQPQPQSDQQKPDRM